MVNNRIDYSRQYYAEHKEQLDTKVKEWKEKNKESYDKYQKDYREAHRKKKFCKRCNVEVTNLWDRYCANCKKESYKESKRKYYQKNKEKIKQKVKLWRLKKRNLIM